MPLEEKRIPVPLHMGIDTYTDPKQTDKMLLMQNMIVDRHGEVTTRGGLIALTSTLTVADAFRAAGGSIYAASTLLDFQGKPHILGADRVALGGGKYDIASGAACFTPSNALMTEWRTCGEHWDLQAVHSQAASPGGSGEVGFAQTDLYEIFVYTHPDGAAIAGPQYSIRDRVTGAWSFHSIPQVPGSITWRWPFHVMVAQIPAGDERFVIVAAPYTTTNPIVIHAIVPATGALTTLALANSSIAATAPGWASFEATPSIEGTKAVALIASKNSVTNKLRLTKVDGALSVLRDWDTSITLDDTASADPDASDWLAVTDFGGTNHEIGVWVYESTVGVDNILYMFPTSYGTGEAPLTHLDLSLVPYGAMALCGAPHTLADSVDGTGTHTFALIAGGPQVLAAAYYEAVSVNIGTFDSAGPTLSLLPGAAYPHTSRMVVCASRPFVWNKRVLFAARIQQKHAITPDSLFANTVLLLQEIRTPKPAEHDASPTVHTIGNLLALDSSPDIRSSAHERITLPLVANLATGPSQFVIPYTRQTRLVGTSEVTMVVLNTPGCVTVSAAARPAAVCLSGKDVIVGGLLPRHIDSECQEIGFLARPEIGLTHVDGAAYQYSGLFEWTDRFGQLYRSAPAQGCNVAALATPVIVSPSSQLSFHGSNTVYDVHGVKIDPNCKQARTRMVLYRTKTGPVYPRKRAETQASGRAWYGYLGNTGDDADATLTNNGILYTDGQELENNSPPAGNILLSHKNRVFIVPFESPRRVYFTKERIAGVGLEFSHSLFVDIAEDITGLAALDDYVIAFTANGIYGFGGSGPNVLGVGSFSTPTRIETDLGCRDPGSVISTSAGVIFKSAGGFMLLNRSLALEPIGLPVAYWNSTVCKRAVALPLMDEIRFLHAGNVILVYDTLRQGWRTWVKAVTGTIGTIADIANINNVFQVLTTDGKIWVETPISGDTLDANVNYAPSMQTPWIKTAGIEGFQRVWWIRILGEFPVSGVLEVKVYHDYSSTATETFNVDVAHLTAKDLVMIKPSVQKCSAISIKISAGAGLDLKWRVSNVELVCGVKSGRMSGVPHAQT